MPEAKEDLLQSKASARWIRITPRKMRLVADMVRGKRVNEAVNVLGFTLKRAASPVEKTVRSALANLMQDEAAAKIDPADVVIREIRVDEGPTLKRWRPRAMGRAYRIQKKTSHLTVVLSAKRLAAPPAPKKAKAPKAAKPDTETPSN